MLLRTAELVAHLRAMADAISECDSFEGRIEYSIAPVKDSWDVEGFYRIGNTHGQGGMCLFRKGEVPSEL